jgi:hypothetical protein
MVGSHAAAGGGRLLAVLSVAMMLGLHAHPAPAAEVESARRFVIDKSIAPSPPARGDAVLWIVREEYVRQLGLPPEAIYVDDHPAGLLPQRTWFEVPLEPGDHVLCGTVDVPAIRFHAGRGDTVLVRMRELVDAQDQRTIDWIYDEPASITELLGKKHAYHVAFTAAGRKHLLDKRGDGCASVDLPPPPADAGGFGSMLIERPLDQRNLASDFFHHTGTIHVDDEGLHWSMESGGVRDVLDVPPEAIGRIRFGGTRATGIAPWVTFDVRDPAGGAYEVSFADSREDHAVATYQRLFKRLVELRRRARREER